MSGPQMMVSVERQKLAMEIAERFQHYFGERVQAIGIYGSLARQADGPYSDIEMFVVLDGEEIDTSYEWSTGSWKAEVNILSAEALEAQAVRVESDWPITHGAFLSILPVYDPSGLFPRLRQLVESQPQSAFEREIQALIIGEIYEMVGKIRNAVYFANADPLAAYIIELALYGARLVGLAERYTYRSFYQLFDDSLCLHNLPAGYRELCGAAMCGDLRSPQLLLEICDTFWQGVEDWARERGLALYTTLDELLEQPPGTNG